VPRQTVDWHHQPSPVHVEGLRLVVQIEVSGYDVFRGSFATSKKKPRKRCTQHGAEFRDCHYHSGQNSIVDRALDCNEVATSQKEKDAEPMPTRLYRVTAASFF
jgi:hypothetical protein